MNTRCFTNVTRLYVVCNGVWFTNVTRLYAVCNGVCRHMTMTMIVFYSERFLSFQDKKLSREVSIRGLACNG